MDTGWDPQLVPKGQESWPLGAGMPAGQRPLWPLGPSSPKPQGTVAMGVREHFGGQCQKRGRHLGTPDWSLGGLCLEVDVHMDTQAYAHTHTHMCVFVFTCVCVWFYHWSISLSIYPTGITDKPGASLGAWALVCGPLGGSRAETDILNLLVGQMEPLGKGGQGQSPAAGPWPEILQGSREPWIPLSAPPQGKQPSKDSIELASENYGLCLIKQ